MNRRRNELEIRNPSSHPQDGIPNISLSYRRICNVFRFSLYEAKLYLIQKDIGTNYTDWWRVIVVHGVIFFILKNNFHPVGHTLQFAFRIEEGTCYRFLASLADDLSKCRVAFSPKYSSVTCLCSHRLTDAKLDLCHRPLCNHFGLQSPTGLLRVASCCGSPMICSTNICRAPLGWTSRQVA